MVFGPARAEDLLRSLPMSLRSLWNICIWRRFGSLHFINKCLGRQRETDGPSWNPTLRPPSKIGRNWNPKGSNFWEFSNDWFLEVPTRCLDFQQFVPENCCPAWHHWNLSVRTWKMGLEEEIPSWKRSWLISTSPFVLEKYTAVLAGETVFEIHLSNPWSIFYKL